MSTDVVTRLGNVLATDSSETLSNRVLAFPATEPPSRALGKLVKQET